MSNELLWLAAAALALGAFLTEQIIKIRIENRKTQAALSDQYFEAMDRIIRDKRIPDDVVGVCRSLGFALQSPWLGRAMFGIWVSGRLFRRDGHQLRHSLDHIEDKDALARVFSLMILTLVASSYNNVVIGWPLRRYVLSMLEAVPQSVPAFVSSMEPTISRIPHDAVAA
jgi:hypothetical protein